MTLNQILGLGINPGSKAPAFSLLDQDNRTHTLEQYSGKWILLFFYPKDLSHGCTAQVCSFKNNIHEFTRAGIVVLGISVDSKESHMGFAKKHELNFPILSDSDKEVSRKYETLLPILGVANRITFLIDPQGKVIKRFRWLPWKTYAEKVLELVAIKN